MEEGAPSAEKDGAKGAMEGAANHQAEMSNGVLSEEQVQMDKGTPA